MFVFLFAGFLFNKYYLGRMVSLTTKSIGKMVVINVYALVYIKFHIFVHTDAQYYFI
jgi:hypothetical protein